jgi:predicted nucleotidyltransferase
MISGNQKEIIIKNLSPYKPKKLGIFGSYARGDNNTNSDLDILVEFSVQISLLDLAGLEQDLSESLGIKVDLVTERALSKYVRPYVEKDYQSILP